MIVNKTGKFRGVKKPDFCRKSVFTARIIECLYVIGRSFIRRINLVNFFFQINQNVGEEIRSAENQEVGVTASDSDDSPVLPPAPMKCRRSNYLG